MSWEKATLGDIADIFSGYAFKSADMNSERGTPLIKIKNIADSRVSHQCDAFLNKDFDLSKYERFHLLCDDFLVAMTGQGSVGRIGKMRSYRPGYYVNQRVAIARVNPQKADPVFVYYQIATKSNELELFKKANGAGQPNISAKQIGELSVLLPPIAAQQYIADILSAYDNLIENNQKQIKLLDEAAQRLYKEWFVDLRFPGYENTPIVDGVPEGWENTTVGNLDCHIESGSRPKGGIDSSLHEGIPSIGAENVIGLGKYNFATDKLISPEFYNSMKRGKLKDRDILIYKDGAYIGRTSLFQDGFPHKKAAVNEHVFLLHTRNEKLQYFLFFTLYQYEYFLKMQQLNKNAAQPGINAKAMLSLELLLPPISLIHKFDEFVIPIMKSIFAKAKQNHELAEARDRLLPKLMNGEIEV